MPGVVNREKSKRNEGMEFQISREAQLIWPDKCVCCLDVSTKKMETSTRWISKKRLKVEYPLCNKHYFWLKGMQISDIVFLVITIWRGHSWGMPYNLDLLFPVIVLVISIFYIGYRPVTIRISGDSYTMKIRNEDYAREFAHLNNLSPIVRVPAKLESDKLGSKSL
jgi:hypothetical protein